MTTTIGLVANIYNEANALPGWLETHLPFFDDVRVLHAGPGGTYSDDGTLEILKKWDIPVQFTDIGLGFGIVRTQALRMSPCDWVMLLDADERFYHIQRHRTCSGPEMSREEIDWILQSYDYSGVNLPNWENLSRLGHGLQVNTDILDEQGERLRSILNSSLATGLDALVTIRRHWHDLAMTRPTQSWVEHPDSQMRLVRNHDSVYFDPNVRMHERLVFSRGTVRTSLYFDHFHFHFKRMEPEQRRHDIAIYDAVHRGEAPPIRI